MLCGAVLCCAVLCCAVLCCAALRCAALGCNVLRCCLIWQANINPVSCLQYALHSARSPLLIAAVCMRRGNSATGLAWSAYRHAATFVFMVLYGQHLLLEQKNEVPGPAPAFSSIALASELNGTALAPSSAPIPPS